MEKAHELGAQKVSLLQIAFAQNQEFCRVTSPALQRLGKSPVEVWKALVRIPDSFKSVSTEELFGQFPIDEVPELSKRWEYIGARYSWVVSKE